MKQNEVIKKVTLFIRYEKALYEIVNGYELYLVDEETRERLQDFRQLKDELEDDHLNIIFLIGLIMKNGDLMIELVDCENDNETNDDKNDDKDYSYSKEDYYYLLRRLKDILYEKGED